MPTPLDPPSNPVPADEMVESIGRLLLLDMSEFPSRLEYNTRVLGGMFQRPQISLLDRAYTLLLDRGWVQRAGAVVSFFGDPKSLVRPTPEGLAEAERLKAADGGSSLRSAQ